ncbi:FAD binding domain-containing protein [Aquamicrobium sp. LC103]|uniref:FAD binding domain-containing protein n=1 Tax=Aquamicrobium sp. LC103 TaxID=1120658 RepID=UPI00063E8539|nr:FAD binding domain-containing protein [Aquamicrobium sp. LC103]TKT78161.1 hypothetical protein XW59_011015 [Aquamicrobium sp. LC103]
MKPAPFDYIRPDTVSNVCALLADNFDARIIAGGQTLIPMLAMRLARPTLLIDVARIAELRRIEIDGDHLVIGAATRQAEAEASPDIARYVPLLHAALPWIGHAPTRSRGTVGGSIANADPSAEIPLVAVTLRAEIILREGEDEFIVPAEDFFIGAMVTAAAPEACLTAVRLPVWNGAVGVGFQEISARRSDFAFASAAAQLSLDPEGRISRIVLGVGGVEDRPVAIDLGEVAGEVLDRRRLSDAVASGIEALHAETDLHASAAYRKRAALDLAVKAVVQAHSNASAALETRR